MIFSGQASDGTIHTDQGKQPFKEKTFKGKQPDRPKQQNSRNNKKQKQLPFKVIQRKIKKQKGKG
jgi:hypothetical protein